MVTKAPKAETLINVDTAVGTPVVAVPAPMCTLTANFGAEWSDSGELAGLNVACH